MRLRLAALGLLFSAGLALAHNANKGWPYDLDCCSDRDCVQQPAEMFEEVAGGGWLIKASGVMVYPKPPAGHSYPKLKQSKDEFFHLCTGYDAGTGRNPGDPASTNVYCLYVPPMGS